MASTPLNLSGMFENSPAAAPRSRERVENIPVDLIDSHPRNTTYVTETMLDPAFRESVAAFGVLQPVLVLMIMPLAAIIYWLVIRGCSGAGFVAGHIFQRLFVKACRLVWKESILRIRTFNTGYRICFPARSAALYGNNIKVLKSSGNTVGHMLKKNRRSN